MIVAAQCVCLIASAVALGVLTSPAVAVLVAGVVAAGLLEMRDR